jgi:hypothetical protein
MRHGWARAREAEATGRAREKARARDRAKPKAERTAEWTDKKEDEVTPVSNDGAARARSGARAQAGR